MSMVRCCLVTDDELAGVGIQRDRFPEEFASAAGGTWRAPDRYTT